MMELLSPCRQGPTAWPIRLLTIQMPFCALLSLAQVLGREVCTTGPEEQCS